jgi:hypothetical protein
MKIGGKTMLYNGRFVQDEESVKATPYDTGKVKIGVFYTPQLYQTALTPEERFMQDIVLGFKPHRPSPVAKFFGRLLSI